MKQIIDTRMSQQDWEDYARAIDRIDPARAQLIRDHAANGEIAVNPTQGGKDDMNDWGST